MDSLIKNPIGNPGLKKMVGPVLETILFIDQLGTANLYFWDFLWKESNSRTIFKRE
jgi:hypothetical protein